MLSTIFAGAAIAISFSAPPGPVAMETIRRGLRGGFGPALNVQLGSIIGDFMWFLIALIGLGPLAQISWVRAPLAIVGVVVLLYLGASGIRDAIRTKIINTADGPNSARGAFRTGMAISIANPMAIGYWLSVGGALVAAGISGTSPAQTASFAGGFVAGTLAWAFIMAAVVRFSKRLINPTLFRAVNFACGLALVVFGVMLATQMLGLS
ncbi:MAG: LysE family transporter [Chloroflexi bacterium]|nr:LysE family transporter [Chloroflexota bacterium]